MDNLESINKISFFFKTDFTGVAIFFKEENLAAEWLSMLNALKSRDLLKRIDVRPLDITPNSAQLNLQDNKYLFTFQYERIKLALEERKRQLHKTQMKNDILDQSKF